MASADPLLQPYALRHLVLRNRLISTAHEPAFTENGLPKDRYRLYHVEKAKGGIGMTMIGGSSVVAPDSAEAFGNRSSSDARRALFRNEGCIPETRRSGSCGAARRAAAGGGEPRAARAPSRIDG